MSFSFTPIKPINGESLKKARLDTLKTFLTDGQLQELFGKYINNRIKSSDRKSNLTRQVTADDIEVLYKYLFDTDETLDEIAEELGLPGGNAVYRRACRTALCLIAQRNDLQSLLFNN